MAKTCRECAHAYGFCGRDYDGRVMLCRCERAAGYKLLTTRQCAYFKERADGRAKKD